MNKLDRRALTQADHVLEWPTGRLDIVDFGGKQVMRLVATPDWRWTTDNREGAGTDLCEQPHLGVVTRGRMGIRMRDGDELEFGTGEAFAIPAGHDGWTAGDDELELIFFDPGTG